VRGVERAALRRAAWIGLGLAAVAGVAAYAMQPHAPPMGERLRYRSPEEGGQYLPEDAPAARIDLPRHGRTYVPAYSHAYVGSGAPVLFAVTLSIRNADVTRPLRVSRVDYHATAGDRVRSFMSSPRVLPPLGTAEYLVEQTDEAGGSGANFIVEWSTDAGGHAPVIEAVMLGTSGAAGYSFSMRGVDVSDAPPPIAAPATTAAPLADGARPAAP
jgi:hypothetical protein